MTNYTPILPLQETFDFVVGNIRKQGKPSRKGDTCLYRSPDGCRCSAGWCIPDEKYRPEMEGHNVFALSNQWRCFQGYDITLLVELQRAHDKAAECPSVSDFLNNFEILIRDIADRCKLQYTAK